MLPLLVGYSKGLMRFNGRLLRASSQPNFNLGPSMLCPLTNHSEGSVREAAVHDFACRDEDDSLESSVFCMKVGRVVV